MAPLAESLLGKSDDNTAADFFLDVGARLNDHVFVGAYWDSLLIMDTSCGDSSTTCEVSEHRYGIEAQVHLAPRAVIDPWIGYGIGRFSRKVDAKSLSMTWNEETNSYDRYVGGTKYLRSRDGWELAILKLGLDFVMFRGHSRVGVVAAVALGSGDDGLARTATTLGLHVALTF